MKFFCEYCGNRIDAEKDSKCPNCGASYKKNKNFIKFMEEQQKENEFKSETKKQVANHFLGVLKFSKWFFLIPIVMFVAILTIMILLISKSVNNQKNDHGAEFDNNVQDMFDSIQENMPGQEEEKEVTVNFNEYATTNKYKVKVDSYTTVEDRFKEAGEGYELVKFQLLVENLTKGSLSSEDVNCIVDGVAQENIYYSGHSTLPFTINSKLTVKGDATFIVPVNATSYDIKYGDNVTIHIEK